MLANKGYSLEVVLQSVPLIFWHFLKGVGRILKRTWKIMMSEDITLEIAIANTLACLAVAIGFILWLSLEILFWAVDRLFAIRFRYWAMIIFLAMVYVVLDWWILAAIGTPLQTIGFIQIICG